MKRSTVKTPRMGSHRLFAHRIHRNTGPKGVTLRNGR